MKVFRGLWLAVLAVGIIMTSSWVQASVASESVTVGDFLTSYARALKIELPASVSPDALVLSLRAAGVKLDVKVDTTKMLTQGDVVRIGKANGLRLTTRTPASALTAAEIEQFFTSYGQTLAQAPSNSDQRFAASDNPPGDPAGHANTDKGKKKGRPFQSPTEPE